MSDAKKKDALWVIRAGGVDGGPEVAAALAEIERALVVENNANRQWEAEFKTQAIRAALAKNPAGMHPTGTLQPHPTEPRMVPVGGPGEPPARSSVRDVLASLVAHLQMLQAAGSCEWCAHSTTHLLERGAAAMKAEAHSPCNTEGGK